MVAIISCNHVKCSTLLDNNKCLLVNTFSTSYWQVHEVFSSKKETGSTGISNTLSHMLGRLRRWVEIASLLVVEEKMNSCLIEKNEILVRLTTKM